MYCFLQLRVPEAFFSVYIVILVPLFRLFLNYFYEKYNISKSNISEKHEKRKYKTWDLHTYYFNEKILQMSKMLHRDENCM